MINALQPTHAGLVDTYVAKIDSSALASCIPHILAEVELMGIQPGRRRRGQSLSGRADFFARLPHCGARKQLTAEECSIPLWRS